VVQFSSFCQGKGKEEAHSLFLFYLAVVAATTVANLLLNIQVAKRPYVQVNVAIPLLGRRQMQKIQGIRKCWDGDIISRPVLFPVIESTGCHRQLLVFFALASILKNEQLIEFGVALYSPEEGSF